MNHPPTPPSTNRPAAPLAPPVGPPRRDVPPPPSGGRTATLRIGDDDRAATATRLGSAFALGYLDLAEYEGRLDRAYAARVRDDLSALTADLPEARRTSPRPDQPGRSEAAVLGIRIHAGAAALAAVVCWVVWTIIGVTTGAWYPWPIWPTMGALIGVLSHAVPVMARNAGVRLPPSCATRPATQLFMTPASWSRSALTLGHDSNRADLPNRP